MHTQKTVLFVMDLVFKDEKTKVDVKCKGIRESTALAGSFLGGAVGGASLMAIPIDNWRFSALGALFFLLLNVDATLKQRVLDMDGASMPKLARFLQDLKAELVVAFYADEAQSAAAFVDRCFEAYVVA